MGVFLKSNLNASGKPLHLTLARDRIRSVKRGHPWVFEEVWNCGCGGIEKSIRHGEWETITSLQDPPRTAPAGSLALLKDKTGDILCKGYYEPGCRIAFRTIALGREKLDDALVGRRLIRALDLRRRMFPDPAITNGYRLVNGEGDGLPGLVIDIYADAAVVKTDGDGAAGFYDVDGVASWLIKEVLKGDKTAVYYKYRSGDAEGRGRLLAGELPKGAGDGIVLIENGARFNIDVVQGQKTGFFLDQRDNRALMGRMVKKGSRVLNLFGYTGGFSVYSGLGGASHVTTVDIAGPAIEAANQNWALNGLPSSAHDGRADDVFHFLEAAASAKEQWDCTVCDPPSFAPSKQAVESGRAAYERVFALAAKVTRPGGMLALASCSSHITSPMFNEICEEAVLGAARRCATVIAMQGQPGDHPFPLACEELRYLKFNLYQLDS